MLCLSVNIRLNETYFQAPISLPKKTNPKATVEEPVDSETLSPLWFAGIYENHFQHQVNKDILTRQSI